MDMCNGPLLGKILLFSLPLMLSSVLQLLFNAADIIIVGKFSGHEALAAVGSTGSIINLITTLFLGLSVGANVLVARYFSSGQTKEASDTVHTSILLSLIGGVVLAAVGVIWARDFLEMMDSPDTIIGLATVYMRIYFAGMPATLVYNYGSAILRAVGDTRRPLYYLFASGILNVILNIVFVVCFNMDVDGVALATVISQCLSALLVVRCLMMEKSCIRLMLSHLHIDREKLFLLLKIGLPAGFQGIVFSLSNVVIQTSVNKFNDITVAGNSAASSLEGFVYVSMNAFYQAALTFTGQNYGAGKIKRVNRILGLNLACVTAVGLILGFAATYFGPQLLSLYIEADDPNFAAVVSAGMERLKVIMPTYFLCGIMEVCVGMMRGLGYSVTPMIISLVGACGLRLLWVATVFSMEQYHTLFVLYLSYPVSWAITFAAHLVCYIIIKRKVTRLYNNAVDLPSRYGDAEAL